MDDRDPTVKVAAGSGAEPTWGRRKPARNEDQEGSAQACRLNADARPPLDADEPVRLGLLPRLEERIVAPACRLRQWRVYVQSVAGKTA